MNYRVVKVPVPRTEAEFEGVINASAPAGHELISIAVYARELIMVFARRP